MRHLVTLTLVVTFLITASFVALAAGKGRWDADLLTFTESAKSGGNGPGTGQISGVACVTALGTQPSSFGANVMLNCDSIGPHNETTIAVNPTDPRNVVAASHTYLFNLDKQNAQALLRIFTEAYVSKDGGKSWTNVHPPNGSYRFLTDPALAFDARGTLYWSNIASHDSVAGAFSDVSVIVERSDDGGLTWTDPITVAKGNGTVSNGGNNALFMDKAWIAVDRSTGPFGGGVYVTWARQDYRKGVQTESPIFFAGSGDRGATWSTGIQISGSSGLCTGPTAPRCDQNDAGFSSPIVGPDGTIYVAFLNHQAAADGLNRDQVLMVRSTDGGATWSDPIRVVGLIHDGEGDYPTNWRGDATLTGCQFRIFAAGNLAISEAPGNIGQLYYVYADNLAPGAAATRANVMVVTSSSRGDPGTWSSPVAVASSAADQIFPWGAVGADGRLRVGYVDRANRAAPGQSCVYGYTLATATSTVAASFTTQALETAPSVASDSRWFRNVAANGTNTRFIGDYTNIAIAPDGTVWATWTDMREVVTAFGRTGHTEHAVAARVPALIK